MFNMLNIEYRCVAAALYPPDDLLVTTNDQVRLMNMFGEPMSQPPDVFGTEDDKLALAKKAMRKYLTPEEAERMDKLDTSRFLLPGSDDADKDKKK